MYTISYLVNGSWVDVTTTDSRPTKALFLLRYNASLIEGCTLCGVFDSKTASSCAMWLPPLGPDGRCLYGRGYFNPGHGACPRGRGRVLVHV